MTAFRPPSSRPTSRYVPLRRRSASCCACGSTDETRKLLCWQARRNMEVAAAAKRKALLSGGEAALQPGRAASQASAVATSQGVTHSLQRTRQLMTQAHSWSQTCMSLTRCRRHHVMLLKSCTGTRAHERHTGRNGHEQRAAGSRARGAAFSPEPLWHLSPPAARSVLQHHLGHSALTNSRYCTRSGCPAVAQPFLASRVNSGDLAAHRSRCTLGWRCLCWCAPMCCR